MVVDSLLLSRLPLSEECLDKLIVKQLGQKFYAIIRESPDLVPHLFFSSSSLANTQRHADVCLRIGTQISRNFSQYKPIALPLVLLGFEKLIEKFPKNLNFNFLKKNLEPIAKNSFEKWIHLSSEIERERALESNYALYCPNVAQAIRSSLGVPTTPTESVGENLTREDNIESILSKLYLSARRGDVVSITNTVSIIRSAISNISEDAYSLIFRLAMMQNCRGFSVSFMEEIVERFIIDSDRMRPRTILRCMQLSDTWKFLNFSQRQKLIDSIAGNIHALDLEDIVPFLQLTGRFGVSLSTHARSDDMEARVAVLLGVTRSLARREEIVSIAKKSGLAEPVDVIDEYESAFIDNYTSK